MSEGISYGGDLVTGGSTKPRDAIQFWCSDPDFIEKAAGKKPNIVLRFIYGAYSHPRDWWVGIIWCLMSMGVFGADSKRDADSWGRDLASLLNFVIKNPTLSVRLITVYLKHQAMNSPEFYGRFAGGLFTNYASRGGRLGARLGLGTKIASSASNFILATTGAMILSVKYGGNDIISIFDSAITGDYSPEISAERYKEIFRSLLNSDIHVPKEEEDALVEIAKGVLACISSPSKYVSENNKGAYSGPHVPVGQVSSSRPDGVMGTIPQGYETNALDVISERRRLSGQ